MGSGGPPRARGGGQFQPPQAEESGHARDATRETLEGIDYLWVKTPAYDGNGASRVVNMATFMARLCSACRTPIDAFSPDLVIASSTYTWDNWAAAYYAKRHRAHYVRVA